MKGLLKEVFPITGTDKEFGCVYSITFNPANRMYVGQSMNPIRRIRAHKHSLEYNKHHCFDMQLDFNNFGWNEFSVHVIETVEKKNINIKSLLKEGEVNAIKALNPFYNTDFRADLKKEQDFGAAIIRLSKDGIYSLVGNRKLIKHIAEQQDVCVQTAEKWILSNSDNLTKASILNLIHKETGIPMADLLTEKLTA